jgi:hypothetical protein
MRALAAAVQPLVAGLDLAGIETELPQLLHRFFDYGQGRVIPTQPFAFRVRLGTAPLSGLNPVDAIRYTVPA